MGFLTSREQFKKFSSLRVAYFIIFVLAFILTEFGRHIYRPFIYSIGTDDFGIADTMGNSLGTMTQIFFMLAVMHSQGMQMVRVVGFITVGYILYEIVQPILPKGVFDWNDVLATLIAGIVSLGIALALHRLFRPSGKQG